MMIAETVKRWSGADRIALADGENPASFLVAKFLPAAYRK
jgi:hypothetical protein